MPVHNTVRAFMILHFYFFFFYKKGPSDHSTVLRLVDLSSHVGVHGFS